MIAGWEHLPSYKNRWPNFTYDEVRCKCGHCGLPLDSAEFVGFLDILQEMRTQLNFPFHMTSVYRCPAYNDLIYVRDLGAKPGQHLDGPHTKGAGDMLVSFERMYEVVGYCTARGLGLGIKQHGEVSGRYVHIDNLGKRLWTYP